MFDVEPLFTVTSIPITKNYHIIQEARQIPVYRRQGQCVHFTRQSYIFSYLFCSYFLCQIIYIHVIFLSELEMRERNIYILINSLNTQRIQLVSIRLMHCRNSNYSKQYICLYDDVSSICINIYYNPPSADVRVFRITTLVARCVYLTTYYSHIHLFPCTLYTRICNVMCIVFQH